MPPSNRERGWKSTLSLPLVLLLLSPVVIALPWRLVQLGATNPGVDHAHFSLWVQDVNRSERLMPSEEPDLGFRAKLEADRESALHNVFRRVYNQPYRLFNLSGLATYLALAQLLDDSFDSLVQISILAAVGAAAFLALGTLALGSLLPPSKRRLAFTSSCLVSAFGFFSFYLHLFSSQGWHNVALCYLMAHVWSGARLVSLLADEPSGGFARRHPLLLSVFAGTFILSFFAYFILPWLAAPALVAQLVASLRRRAARPIAAYLGFAALVTAPAAIVVFHLWSQAAPNLEQAQFSSSGFLARGIGWLEHGVTVLSLPGFAAALAGLTWLMRQRVVLPGIYLLCHLLVSAASSRTGEEAWLRAYAYAIPFLLVGLAFSAALGIRTITRLWPGATVRPSRSAVAVAAALLIGASSYVAPQARALTSEIAVCSRIPRYCAEYLGGSDLREVVREIDSLLPADASLLPASYATNDLYQILTRRSDVVVLSPLDSLRLHRAGRLRAHAKARGLHRPDTGVVYLLVRSDHLSVTSTVPRVLGPAGLGWTSAAPRFEQVANWYASGDAYQRLELYRIDP